MLTTITGWLTYLARITPYRDLVEILFFSTVIYFILLWLRKDEERNLIAPFYVYCAFIFAAHYADLQVMRFVLLTSMPAVAILFIILHKETLQKNFIKLSKNPATLLDSNDWIDELIKCGLTALNRNKEIVLVIERNDALKTLIHAPYFIYAELKKDLFDILLEKHTPTTDYMIWLNQQGKIVSINSTWRTQLDATWLTKEAVHMHLWKQQALYITEKMDALLVKVNPLTRNFDLVMQGKLHEGMHAEQASAFLKKNLLATKRITPATAAKPSQQTATK